MKKIILYSVCILGLIYNASAQKTKGSNNAFAINLTTPFLRIISGFARDTNLFFAPSVAYERKISPHSLLRIGGIASNSTDNETAQGFSDKQYNIYQRYGAILTYYRIKEIDDRWRFYYGPSLSGLYQSKDFYSDSGFDLTNIYVHNKGAALGISSTFECILNKKLSLYTEYSVFYSIFELTEGKEFSAFPTDNYETKNRTSKGLQLQYPLGVYLKYTF